MALAKPTKNIKNPLKRSLSMPMMMPTESESEDGPGPIPPVESIFDNMPEERAAKTLEIEEEVEDVIALENETALFECKVAQDLKPTCTWHKDGNTLQSDDARISVIKNSAWHRLEIKHVTTSDQGIYTIECRHNDQYISVKGHLFVAPLNLNNGVFYHKLKYTGSGVIKHLSNIKVTKSETIVLEAKFNYESEGYIWYKNNDVILQDRRTSTHNFGTTATMTIVNARPTDSGVYFVVAKIEQGYLSSFADVQVGDRNEKRQFLPIFEEFLPDDVEALVGEEMRLIVKARVDTNTIIKWEKNNVEIKTNEIFKVDYGCNYIGLNIPNPVKSSAGEYKVTLMNSAFQQVVSTATTLTVNLPQPNPPKVRLLRPLETAVACCGSKVSFDCRYDLEDSLYFYVVWYVGHYKVERTNSLFNVLCNGDQFLLYIKKLEPSMAGDVICELRRAWPNRKSAMIKRAHARLVIVPLPMIQEAKTRPVLNGKLYYERNSDEISIRIEDIDDNTRSMTESEEVEAEYLKIAYCRLDDEGLYFVHAVRGIYAPTTSILKVYADESSNVVTMEWSHSLSSGVSWYGIELGQANGSFAEAGITSRSFFKIEKPPIDRMMTFRIRAVERMNHIHDSEVYIVPPPEIVMRLTISHEIQPMEDFSDKFTKTEDIIGAGAFGSVVLVRDNDDGAHYAAKFVTARTEKKRNHILREFHIMKSLRHSKLIELIGFYESRLTCVFVMEYCWGGELFDRVVGEEYLKEGDVVGYVKQICEGLDYMHTNAIVHLDLKPENIICISPYSRQVKLIDFGLARNVSEDISRLIYGTRDYVAPEIIDFEPISTASDMWSLGVVTYTLLSGVMPFGGNNWIERSVNITRACYDYDDYAFDEVSELAKDFVDHLLLRRPSMRMSATNALQHQWIKEGPPQGAKAKHMNKMRQNLKSYLADYRLRWQRAGNVMIAAHRLRMKARQDPSME